MTDRWHSEDEVPVDDDDTLQPDDVEDEEEPLEVECESDNGKDEEGGEEEGVHVLCSCHVRVVPDGLEEELASCKKESKKRGRELDEKEKELREQSAQMHEMERELKNAKAVLKAVGLDESESELMQSDESKSDKVKRLKRFHASVERHGGMDVVDQDLKAMIQRRKLDYRVVLCNLRLSPNTIVRVQWNQLRSPCYSFAIVIGEPDEHSHIELNLELAGVSPKQRVVIPPRESTIKILTPRILESELAMVFNMDNLKLLQQLSGSKQRLDAFTDDLWKYTTTNITSMHSELRGRILKWESAFRVELGFNPPANAAAAPTAACIVLDAPAAAVRGVAAPSAAAAAAPQPAPLCAAQRTPSPDLTVVTVEDWASSVTKPSLAKAPAPDANTYPRMVNATLQFYKDSGFKYPTNPPTEQPAWGTIIYLTATEPPDFNFKLDTLVNLWPWLPSGSNIQQWPPSWPKNWYRTKLPGRPVRLKYETVNRTTRLFKKGMPLPSRLDPMYRTVLGTDTDIYDLRHDANGRMVRAVTREAHDGRCYKVELPLDFGKEETFLWTPSDHRNVYKLAPLPGQAGYKQELQLTAPEWKQKGSKMAWKYPHIDGNTYSITLATEMSGGDAFKHSITLRKPAAKPLSPSLTAGAATLGSGRFGDAGPSSSNGPPSADTNLAVATEEAAAAAALGELADSV